MYVCIVTRYRTGSEDFTSIARVPTECTSQLIFVLSVLHTVHTFISNIKGCLVKKMLSQKIEIGHFAHQRSVTIQKNTV